MQDPRSPCDDLLGSDKDGPASEDEMRHKLSRRTNRCNSLETKRETLEAHHDQRRTRKREKVDFPSTCEERVITRVIC